MFDYLNSRTLHELCDGNRLLLTECRRSDKELFDFSLSLRKQDFKIKEEEHPTSICFTNAKRIERNRYWMDKLAPNCNVIVKALSWDPNSQDTRVNNKQFDIAIVHKPRRIAFRHDFRSDFCVQKYHPPLLLSYLPPPEWATFYQLCHSKVAFCSPSLLTKVTPKPFFLEFSTPSFHLHYSPFHLHDSSPLILNSRRRRRRRRKMKRNEKVFFFFLARH